MALAGYITAGCFYFACFLVAYVVSIDSDVQTCRGGNFVCTTLTLYKDGYIANEGPNCHCGSCTTSWNETDGRSITWHHYEKSDQLVQYRFCSDIIPYKICDKQQMAAIMETDVNAWNIRIKSIDCQCPGGIYYMSGWWKKGGVWSYKYVCNLPVCSETDVCTKVYVNSVGAKLGYEFSCVCGEDDICPTNIDASLNPQSDEDGQFVSNRCKMLRHR